MQMLLSKLPLTIVLLSGEKASELTLLVCPSNVASCWHKCASQTQTPSSWLPAATLLPSGDTVTAKTADERWSRNFPISFLVDTFQTQMLLSLLPLIILLLSGVKATELTRPECP